MTVFDEDNGTVADRGKPELKKSFPVRIAEAAVFFIVAYGFVSMLAIPLFRIKTEPLMVLFLVIPFLALYAADFIFSDPISSILALLPLSAALGAGSFYLIRSEPVVIYVIGFYLLVVSHRVIARMNFDFIRLAGYSVILIISYMILRSFDPVASRCVMYGFFAAVIAGAVIASVSSFDKAVVDESSLSDDLGKTGGIRIRLALCTGVVVACAALISLTAGKGLSDYDEPVSRFIVRSVPGINVTGKDTGQVKESFKKMGKGPGDMFKRSGTPGYVVLIIFLTTAFIALISSIAGLFLFALFLINMWRFISRRDRSRDNAVNTQNIFSMKEIKERVRFRWGGRAKKRTQLPGGGDKPRIRKLYREIVIRIVSGGNIEIGAASTPREIEHVISIDGRISPDDAADITDAYERARYAQTVNPEDDLRKIRLVHDMTNRRRNP